MGEMARDSTQPGFSRGRNEVLLLLEVTACFDIIPNVSTTMVALYYAHVYASIPLPNMTSF